MALIVKKEPYFVTKEWRGLLEKCVFCKMPTKYWYKEKEPVCESCATEKNESDLKN